MNHSPIDLLADDLLSDEEESSQSKESRLADLQLKISQLPLSVKRAELLLDCGTLHLDFQQKKEAWDVAREAFDLFAKEQAWELAVVATDIMVASDQKESLIALAHGVWIGITYPINPETTNAILQYMIDESPTGSDTAAVAAVTSHFLADLRQLDGQAGENLLFFTNRRLAEVAAQHRNIKNQEEFDIWMVGNEFDNPDSFLPKLSAAIDALANNNWWIDREALRAALP
ncbi:MAG: hypothetical protein HON68_05480 [Gammaproteobacteria bacterium]|jgi:hypothetical protein|nr:hypothetical protein [Gammaproteobacteria bacterium]MBT3490454.1 hypothetical protein [Gammaproteobacteria bacterium]MBT3717615.1 hypothetical protein [Gammaproteobacteria bacterium]MBT3845808.1 hypothetical protein [Gammaproteobacteria bacterium]MBT3893584.1 hypothetical protein [Gammaproteobacteria bacterium]